MFYRKKNYNKLIDDSYRLSKYKGCFSSLRKYPNEKIIKYENYNEWKKFAIFVSGLIYETEYKYYSILRKFDGYSTTSPHESIYNLPSVKTKITKNDNKTSIIVKVIIEEKKDIDYIVYYNNYDDYLNFF